MTIVSTSGPVTGGVDTRWDVNGAAVLGKSFVKARDRLRPEAERRAAEQEDLEARHAAEQEELDARYQDLVTEYRALDDEEGRLRTIVMGEIGTARGITGVATWETVYGRGKFDEEWLRDDEPEMFEK